MNRRARQQSVPQQAVAAAAHELKIPLSNIHFISESLLDSLSRAEADNSELLRRQLQLVSDTARHGLATVDGMTMAYSARQLKLDLETLNAGLVCEEVMHQLVPLADILGVKTRLSLPATPPRVVANRRALYSVLSNLCDNAIRHAAGDDGFRLALGRSRHQVVFNVDDYGPKLELAQFRKLKKHLGQQVQPITGRSGSGLGLVIAAELTEAMHGTLGLIRHRMGGMTFKVCLPASNQLSWI